MEDKGLSVETPVSFRLDGGRGRGWDLGQGRWGSCQHWMVGTPEFCI